MLFSNARVSSCSRPGISSKLNSVIEIGEEDIGRYLMPSVFASGGSCEGRGRGGGAASEEPDEPEHHQSGGRPSSQQLDPQFLGGPAVRQLYFTRSKN